MSDAVIGVLLAAGKGTRMGRTKQLVPIASDRGTSPLVAAAFDSIASSVSEMWVVVGHNRAAVVAALRPRQFRVIESSPDAEMVDSFRAALGCVLHEYADPTPTILLQLGDHPRVAIDTLQRLLAASQQRPHDAIIPRFQGRGGHPILIPSEIAKMLINEPLPGGLKTYWRANPDRCTYVEVQDPGVHLNLNTPDDLQQRLPKGPAKG